MEVFYMKAATVSIQYQPGDFYISQGHKGYEKKHRNKAGRTVNPIGFGWAAECKPSRIVVGVEVNSKYAEVYADRYFKDSWGRLTAGRVEAIMDSLPDELSVTENETHAGSIYYTIDENCMDKWLKAAKALL